MKTIRRILSALISIALLALVVILVIYRAIILGALINPVFWQQHWGDIASTCGVLIALVGFTITISVALRSKSAAQQARGAANRALQSMTHFDALIEISIAIRTLDEIRQHFVDSNWPTIPQKFAGVRSKLTLLRCSIAGANKPLSVRLASVAQQLNDIDSTLSRWLQGPQEKNPPSTAKNLDILKNQVDKLTEIQAELRLPGVPKDD